MTDQAQAPRPPSQDPLRLATPRLDDVEARRARAAVEGRLFTSTRPPQIHVGRYRVVGRIGTGGMGVVYRAHDPELARDVAVKLMNPDTTGTEAGPTAQARLLREARAMAQLAHPNVIHVYDVGTVQDGVFIAMELVDGEPLSARVGASGQDWRQTLRLFIDAGRGLAAAHAAGIIHRDFKPENVLVGKDGRVRVGDFGLAGTPQAPGAATADGPAPAVVDGGLVADSLTRTGALLGTPKYMAPEQEAGGLAGVHSDQFSFCVALYEGLYGCAPFEGETVTRYRLNVRDGVLRPSPKETRVPSWIRQELLRGLARDPAARHPSMDALLDRLEQALVDRRPRRSPGRTALVFGALVLTAVVAGLAVGVPRERSASESEDPLPGAVGLSSRESGQAPSPTVPSLAPASVASTTASAVTVTTQEPSGAEGLRPGPARPASAAAPTSSDAPSVDRRSPEAVPPKRATPVPTPKAQDVSRPKQCYFRETDDGLIRSGFGRTHQEFVRDDHDNCYRCGYRAPAAKVPGLNPTDCTAYWLCTKDSPDKCSS